MTRTTKEVMESHYKAFRKGLDALVADYAEDAVLMAPDGMHKGHAAIRKFFEAELAGFPDGFETLVGERGLTLSGGQKQRTAIARAILREPKILILDDALSSVDTYTEEKILGKLRGVMRGRTSLIVSHRISTVRDADTICVLDEGRIIERGTHDELLALGGEYSTLYERQLLEEELALT